MEVFWQDFDVIAACPHVYPKDRLYDLFLFILDYGEVVVPVYQI